MSIFIDPDVAPAELRQRLYAGHLVVLTRLESVGHFVEHTRQQLGALFAPYDPQRAHEHFDKVAMARMLGAWKPAFIHSAASKWLVRAIVAEAGFGAEGTHYDLPEPAHVLSRRDLRLASPMHSHGTVMSGIAPPHSRSIGGFRSSLLKRTTA